MEIECNVNDWYEASRAIMDTYCKTIAKDWDDVDINVNSFNTPSEFTILMQSACVFSMDKDMQIKALEREIVELMAEIAELKGELL